MIRPILAPALLAAALVTSAGLTPALADDAEDNWKIRLANYSLTLAESFGQAAGIAAQCFDGAEFVPRGRIAVLDLLEGHLSANGLARAAIAYERGVKEMRAQYVGSCRGASEARKRVLDDSRRYIAEIQKMLGFDKEPAEKTGTSR